MAFGEPTKQLLYEQDEKASKLIYYQTNLIASLFYFKHRKINKALELLQQFQPPFIKQTEQETLILLNLEGLYHLCILACNLKLKIQHTPIQINEQQSSQAAWILLSTIQEYLISQHSMSKENLQFLDQIRQGDYIVTSKEFRIVTYLTCFNTGVNLFFDSQSYLLNSKDLIAESQKQEKPGVNFNIKKLWGGGEMSASYPDVDINVFENAFKRELRNDNPSPTPKFEPTPAQTPFHFQTNTQQVMDIYVKNNSLPNYKENSLMQPRTAINIIRKETSTQKQRQEKNHSVKLARQTLSVSVDSGEIEHDTELSNDMQIKSKQRNITHQTQATIQLPNLKAKSQLANTTVKRKTTEKESQMLASNDKKMEVLEEQKQFLERIGLYKSYRSAAVAQILEEYDQKKKQTDEHK